MARVPADQRRRDLVEAAIRVATEHGIAATTTRRIATEAGASLANVHYCFRSKQELLEHVITNIVNELVDAAVETVHHGEDVGESLRESLHGLWKVVEREPGKQLVTYEVTSYALRQPGMSEFAQWQYETYATAAGEMLTKVAEAADVQWSEPMPVLSRMLSAFIDGLTLAWLVDRDTDRAIRALDSFADQMASLAVATKKRRRVG